jgi:hypothetical protein
MRWPRLRTVLLLVGAFAMLAGCGQIGSGGGSRADRTTGGMRDDARGAGTDMMPTLGGTALSGPLPDARCEAALTYAAGAGRDRDTDAR